MPMKKLITLIMAVLLALSTLTVAFAATYTDKETVKRVQQAFNDAGYDCGMPDGIAGKKTVAMITQYQTDKGLETTGQIDDALLEAMGIKVEEPETQAEESGQTDPASSEDQLQGITFEEAGISSPIAIQDAKEVIGEWTASSVWIVYDEKQMALDPASLFGNDFSDSFISLRLAITDDTFTVIGGEGSILGEQEMPSPWNLTEDGGIGMPKQDSDDVYTIYLCDDGTLPYDFYVLGFNFRVFFSRNPEN